jgi:hypothetical protein
MTEYKVQAIRLVLRKSALKTSKQIEAIGISSSAQVVNQYVKVASDAPKKVIRENLGKTINSKILSLRLSFPAMEKHFTIPVIISAYLVKKKIKISGTVPKIATALGRRLKILAFH